MNYYYITGTSRGIGQALALRLLKEADSRVYGYSRSKSIEHQHYQHQSVDLGDTEQLQHFEFHEHPDADRIVLINNAGALGEVKHLGELSDRQMIHSLTANLIAPAVLMNRFIRQYKDTACEKLIINVSSGAAQNPYDGWGIYSTGKAGLEMVSRVADLEQHLKEVAHPVRVLSIAPGVVDTHMQEMIRETDEAGFSRKQKFLELKENDALYRPEAVAEAFYHIIENPDVVEGVTYRVKL